MRVTVLGKSPSWQDAGGACSGYLVQDADTTLLLDCGNGVFGKLRSLVDYTSVDAVVLSHLHADHFLDLVPFSYALTYSPQRSGARPVLHAPPGAGEIFRRIVGAWGNDDLVDSAFDLREYSGSEELAVGSLRVRFGLVAHFVQTFAVELSAGAGRFVFGADTGPSDGLVGFATGAEVLMVEATLESPDEGHLTAEQAGEHAARAGVGRLVLTHITDELDAERAREAAAASFGGPVEVAREGATYEL
ncbi:MAG: MBL fold metallo-hydrolase [Solirubrobacteraceae bacterium]